MSKLSLNFPHDHFPSLPGSGEIDFSEFCTLMARQMEKSDPEYEYKKAFTIFDKRGDGFIDAAELKHVMTNIGEDMSDYESEFQCCQQFGFLIDSIE